MSDAEADAIFATFAEIEGYEETVEVSVATRLTLTHQVALLPAAARRWYHANRQRTVPPSTKCARRYSDHPVVDAAFQREYDRLPFSHATLRLADDAGREARRGIVELLSPKGVPPAVREERGADFPECTGMMRCTCLSMMHLSLDEIHPSLSEVHVSLAMNPSLNARSTTLSLVPCLELGHTRTVMPEPVCVICACSYTPAQDAPRPTPNTSAA